MTKAHLLWVEKRLLMRLNGVPLQIRLMLANTYDAQMRTVQGDTSGEEEELFLEMEELIDEYKDARNGS